ncbi:sensor histidine kinase [Loktanella sp. S4079]|uniref:sensor histidine kinase n=1 Tax=Loktanella sp. S4079 TaxID=579483 RepID=UPI0005F9BA0B|nr:sensor histidine kinase [Loktanella sp. S4079]KJZ18562.1 hypothetical protein TW80_14175 [Loktanella sp. S4079]
MITRLKSDAQTLTFRMAALLAVTLLPIGMVSVLQTYKLLDEADRKSEANILLLTAEAAAGEEAYIRTAFGAAQAIAAMVPRFRRTGWDCDETLSAFLQSSQGFSFAGYINAEGTVACASGGEGMNVAYLDLFQDMRTDPEQRVAVMLDAPVSKTSVIVVAVPVMQDGVFDGYVGVSLPHRRLFRPLGKLAEDRPVDLITFNADAEILSADGGLENIHERLPAGTSIPELLQGGEAAFTGETRGGLKRVFAVVPILRGTVYALGSWEYKRHSLTGDDTSILQSLFFPVAMWIACVGVAFFAVQRMVIRPTRNLRARMLQFMRSRKISPPKYEVATPRELREMDETWQMMAESVLRDEAELHNAIHEKGVLLKEVHHRVKNNLQLIASILNMKMRKARTPVIKAALNDIQQRVMSIARVHQKLYETSTEERVRADELLGSIVGQIVESVLPSNDAVKVTQRYDPIVVYPDQAVPLTLAVSELVTNALKYLGKPANGKPWLEVTLDSTSEGGVLTISNSLGQEIAPEASENSGGLGVQLVRAFVQQMEGHVTDASDDAAHRVVIHFPISEFDDSLIGTAFDAQE